MGATGRDVWKTTDGGNTWNNISDGYFNTTGIGDDRGLGIKEKQV